jgi:amino acid adenylation domain-containing protein
MRGETRSAEESSRRSATNLLQRDTLKVLNMLDLARELSGESAATTTPASNGTPQASPAEFWKRSFAHWRGATPLVVTIAPSNRGARRAAQLTHTFPELLVEEWRAFAEQTGIPLGTLFHAAWALLLHKYSGEDDVVFGMVKGCLEREGGDNETAVHIVPSRVMFTDTENVRHWLRTLAEQARETAPFEFLSLEQIRQAAQVPAEHPMFESVLSIGHESFDPLSIATAQPNADQSRPGADTYPLVASVQFGREVTLRVAYSPQKFSEEAIKLMLGHWQTLVTNFARFVDQRVEAVPMLTQDEREQIFSRFNTTAAPWPSHLCVHQLFEEQVERTPDEPAVMFQGEALTYRELNYRANQLAHHLRALGVGPDSVVGICLERSLNMVVGVLAALKSGAAYLPLDPTYPHDRLQFMLEDSKAKVLLTQSKLRSVFPNLAAPALLLDEDWSAGARLSRENPPNLTTPENLSYLIYTSGSTGKPKGVAMVHRPLVNLIDWQLRDSRLGAGARTLQFTSLSFDVSFQEMFATWCSGGTLMLITAELRLSPRELWSFIVREKVARIFLPFVALQQLADAAAAEGTTAEALREVVTAGEQLQVTRRLRELFARHPEATLHNHYGPSETHVVTALTLSGDPEQWPALPSIGRPIQNTRMYLLDKRREPVALGLPGELFIGGVALARGYYERPEVTAEKFVRDVFDTAAEGRLYRTGDLARYLPNGEIEFLGRIDHQVKIRGYRVELGEIEAALNKHATVRESAVVAREQAPGQKQLVAYVVPQRPAEANVAALRAALKQQLPDYMVPSAFVFLEKMPLTPSGKVDRKSLPSPEQAATPAAPPATQDKPWLPIQFQLVQIWEEVLGVKPVGIRDNFFEIGGHSLLAVKMMDRVEEVTGRKLPVTALFEEPTITHLADLILKEEQTAAAPVIELRTSGHRPPVYFLHGDIIGGGFYARDIARLLGEQQPFYVLPPVELEKGVLPSVQDMASKHLRDLRAHRPRGPYLLGGFCIGALVAYEMAVRLAAAGEDVPFVALIDPQLPSNLLRVNLRMTMRMALARRWSAEQTVRAFARGHKVLYRLREEWNSPLRDKVKFVAAKTRRLVGAGSNGIADSGKDADRGVSSDQEQEILSMFHWIIASYEPPRHDGPVALFLTDEQKAFTPFLTRKWRKAAPKLEAHRIPGKHLAAITTNVDILSAKLTTSLEKLSVA